MKLYKTQVNPKNITMKYKALIFLSSLLCAQVNAGVSFGGTALAGVPGLAEGQVGITLVDTTGDGFGNLGSLGGGLSLTDSATYGSSLVNVAKNTAASTFVGTNMSGLASFDLSGGITTGNRFGIAVFTLSSESTLGGDTINFWTDPSWLVPSDGAAETFGDVFTQFSASDSPTGTFNVVPEPSAFAALAGILALGFVSIRRRR